MAPSSLFGNRRGIALFTVLLLSLALSALVIGGTLITTNSTMIRRYGDRMSMIENAALAGLEEGRSALNGTPALYPDSGFVTLESGVAVVDAAGNVIPNLSRSTYAGPSGASSGQFGVFGSIISIVADNVNILMVRRQEITQESFAKFSYFTDDEGVGICFGGGDNIFGPVHSNDDICIYNSGARFRDPVTTAKTIVGKANGTFDLGYTENVTNIPMPTPADLVKLQTQATIGGMAFPGFTTGGTGQARTRIEFVALDLNGDLDTTDEDEGFIRVFQGNSGAERYVVASPVTFNDLANWNCGDVRNSGAHPPHGATANFVPLAQHTSSSADRTNAANHSSTRCYLGGDPALSAGVFQATPPGGFGSWLPWTGPIDPRVVTAAGALQAGYLHPITRDLNPTFKGVIHVDGKVAISGTVRSRVTVAATGDVIIADNVRQATDPSVGVCDDILGIVAGGSIIMANNMINAPVQKPNTFWQTMRPVGNGDEWVHAVLLTLNIFTVQNYNTGASDFEDCGTTNWGRGCLQLTGGLIQRTRGAVGTSGGTGNLKRYSYNTCALTDPPPYFPTTGHFARNRFYTMDPVGFDVATWFSLYQQ